MKILRVGMYWPQTGGPPNGTRQTSRILAREHDVAVVHMREEGEKRTGHWKDGKVEVYQEKLLFPRRLTSLQAFFQTTKRAWRLRKGVDIYHVHGPFFAGIGFLDRERPMVLHIHGYPSLEALSRERVKRSSFSFRFIRWMEKKAVKRADAIIVVDSTIGRWARSELGADRKKVFLIPNGVDTEMFSPDRGGEEGGSKEKEIKVERGRFRRGKEIRRRCKLEDDGRLIVCIRRFAPKNGVENVLEGFIEYVKEYDGGVEKQKGRERQKGGEGQESHLLLAGGGPLRRSLAKRIKEEKMENRITLAGEIPHARLPAYYNSADIIINSFTHIPLVREHPLSSVREGLEKGRPICTSLTTLEALSAGKPVILSTVGGTYSGVDHEDLGAVVPDGHPEQMANAIHTLLSDNEKANKMGARAREYVVHNRSWERVTEKMLRVYDFVLRDTG